MAESVPAAFEPSGVLAAAITPRKAGSDSIDLAAMLEVVDFLSAAHLSGLVLLGTTGEFFHFDLDSRAKAAAIAIKRSSIPVIVNASHSTLDGAVWLAQEAAAAGAAAVLLMPPSVIPYPQPAIRQFFLDFAARAAISAPIYLYNIPQATSLLAPTTAVELLETGRFAGIKDSSGDQAGFSQLLEASRRLGFRLFSGSERIYAWGRQNGAHGIISGAASAVPELVVALDRAITSNADPARIAQINARLIEFVDHIETLPMTFGIKLAAGLRGLKTGPTAIPLPEPARQFSDWFSSWWRDAGQQVRA
jgi:4-hydroxy-tetrahydrodipicolinate synthase